MRRVYDASAYGLDVLLAQGRYNCVSATVFEALLASSVGLDAGIVAGPRHVFLRLETDGRSIDVETTTARGWDVTRDVRRIAGFLLAYRPAAPEDLARGGVAALYDQYRGVEPPAPVSTAAAFVWHVRGESLAERGDGPGAAAAFDPHTDHTLIPEGPPRVDRAEYRIRDCPECRTGPGTKSVR